MENTEVEKKFIVKDKSALMTVLEKQGEKVFENHQVDTYYIPAHRDFMAEKYPFEWLRLRNDDGKYKITYKHWRPENTPVHTHCDEYETTVGDIASMEKIFAAIDLKKAIVVDKFRTAFHIDNFEVAIDEVKELGIFTEIEIKSGYSTVEEALEQIYKFAAKLGLKEIGQDDILQGGYANAIFWKNKKVKPD